MKACWPGGPATGALAGQYPQPAMGLVNLSGPGVVDDFCLNTVLARYYGDRFWSINTIVHAPGAQAVVPTAETEYGITQLSSAAAANDGGTLAMPDQTIYSIPTGWRWATKIAAKAAADATNVVVWSGYCSTNILAPTTAAAVSFVGLRVDTSVDGNVYFVVKDGAGAGNETTQDLGVAYGATYYVYGFERLEAGTLQPFVWSAADRRLIVEIGNAGAGWDGLAATNLPAVAMVEVALGVTTLENAAKTAYIDFWSAGGRCAR